MHVSLTPMLENFVKSKVATGLYNNASEVVREALRVLYQNEHATLSHESIGQHPPTKDVVKATLQQNRKPLHAMGISCLYLFGSVLHGDASTDSDIDLFFESDKKDFSLFDLVTARDRVEEILQHKVDLLIKEGIDPLIKNKVIAEAERIF